MLTVTPAPAEAPTPVLRALAPTRARRPRTTLRVALLFPGQGSQHPRMAAGLYGHADVFTEEMDRAFDLLGDDGPALRAAWLDPVPGESFDDVTVAQPLLYAVGHALGQEVLSWGVEPTVMLGHSIGEVVAATVADVLSLPDGIALMRDRMRVFADTPPGGMLAVAASEDDVRDLLPRGAHVAAVNGSRQLLLAGGDDALRAASDVLERAGFVVRPARARQAFHSPVVADATRRTHVMWERTPLRPPRRGIRSGYTTRPIDAATACDPLFWAEQPAMTVRFGPALAALLDSADHLLVEAGPSAGLSALARRQPAVLRGHSAVLPLLPVPPGGDVDDRATFGAATDTILRTAH